MRSSLHWNPAHYVNSMQVSAKFVSPNALFGRRTLRRLLAERAQVLVCALTAVFLLAYNQNVKATHAEVAELEDALA